MPYRSPRALACALAVALALLSALPYLIAGAGTFIGGDDFRYITQNPVVLQGVSAAGVRWAFTTFHASNWHPLTWLSHMLDVSLFGLDARGHHATSVLLHALNTALLFLALDRLSGRRWPSAFVAALFGAHPLHVESVAWVAERKDVLAGFFFMLVLLAYERYSRRGGVWRYLCVLALLALGLAAKPMLVTLPFVLLLLDFWPLGRMSAPHAGTTGALPFARLLAEKAPLLALSAASSAVTILAQQSGGAIVGFENTHPGLRAANGAVSATRYLVSTVWPTDLACFYPYPERGIPAAQILMSALLLATLSLAAAISMRRRPYLTAGGCWFAGMLVPVLGLIQVGLQARADRYTYLPLIGIFIAVAWLASDAGRLVRHAALVTAIAAVISATVLSTLQAKYWLDGETLYRRAIAVTSDNWHAQNNLGETLYAQGRKEEALLHFQEALRIRPGTTIAVLNTGGTLLELGLSAEAIGWLREAVLLMPLDFEAHYRLGRALFVRGLLHEAEPSYREAVRIRPDFAEAHVDLGAVLANTGRLAEAESCFREALRLKPDLLVVHVNLGRLLAILGRPAEAAQCYAEALRIAPASVEVRQELESLRAR
ncbi:MAG: tetratricopeptide repeat protein [Gammaproteobacteria bacterium]|nr:tetratricopeptide repeat protein [Gammaproteobacteria bacterium]